MPLGLYPIVFAIAPAVAPAAAPLASPSLENRRHVLCRTVSPLIVAVCRAIE